MKKDRIVWLDFARSFAIISVVIMHCFEAAYKIGFEEVQKLSLFSNVFRACGYTFGRLGVPVFFAISGYLLLNRDFSSDKKILSFYKNNLVPLVLTSEIWILIYSVRKLINTSGNTDIGIFIRDMLFLKTHEMGHMWYIPAIIGIYIAVPFVSNAVKGLSNKTLMIPLAIVLTCYYGIKLYNIFGEVFGWEILLERKLELGFLGGVYGAYLIFGLLCKRGALRKIHTAAFGVGAVGSFAFSVFTVIISVKKGYDFHIGYDFIGVFVCAVCLFELFNRIQFKGAFVKKITPLFTQLSLISFGIYFIHKPLLDDINGYILDLGLVRPINSVLIFVIVFIISAFIAFIISKIPKIKKWLLYIK